MARKRFPAALGVAGTTLLATALVVSAIAGFSVHARAGRLVTTVTTAHKEASTWTGTWAAAPQPPRGIGFDNVTLRLIVHTTIGGRAARITLANTFGISPLKIGAASVGVESAGAAIEPGTLRTLTFNGGHRGAVIMPGQQLTSDGVTEQVPADANLAVSLYLPVYTGPPTVHGDGGDAHQISYVSTTGNYAADPTAAEYPKTTGTWFYLDGVAVDAPGTAAVVALGDSITDGTHSTVNTNHRYPNWLFDRLQAAGGPYARLSVLDEGIGGNELLRTSSCCGHSPSGLDRLDPDVLDQPGVKDVIVMLGTNDILGAHRATATEMIAGLRELITRAHARGVRVFGGTIVPSKHYTLAKNQTRLAVNQWILDSGAFDGVVNFAAGTADPIDPAWLRPVYASRDHLHPDDTGYHAMADAVDLPALLGKPNPGPALGGSCLLLPSFRPITPGAGINVTCQY